MTNTVSKFLVMNIAVSPIPYIKVIASLSYGFVNELYVYQIECENNIGEVTWSTPTVPDGLSIDPVTGILSGIVTEEGYYDIYLKATDSVGRSHTLMYRNVQFLIAPPRLMPFTWPVGVRSEPYTLQLSVYGGTPPYTWQMTEIPGLSISDTGLVSGIPTIRVLDVDGEPQMAGVMVSDSRGYYDVINNPIRINGANIIIEPFTLPDIIVNQYYSLQLSVSGGTPPYTWQMPNIWGLTINPSTGLISGTPTSAGTATFNVIVYDQYSDFAVINKTLYVLNDGVTKMFDLVYGNGTYMTVTYYVLGESTMQPGTYKVKITDNGTEIPGMETTFTLTSVSNIGISMQGINQNYAGLLAYVITSNGTRIIDSLSNSSQKTLHYNPSSYVVMSVYKV
jgi:hypothetical protein